MIADTLAEIGVPVPPLMDTIAPSVIEWEQKSGVPRRKIGKMHKRAGIRSPTKYVQLVKLLPALEAIANGERMDRASYRNGYTTQFEMSKSCRRLFGMWASQMRAADWREVVRGTFA